MKPTVYLRFEQFDIWGTEYTLHDCINLARNRVGNFMMENQKGFRFSQVIDSMLYYYNNHPDSDDTILFEHISSNNSSGYIVPVAVQYHPNDWSDITNGVRDPSRKSIFELIHPDYLRDMQDRKAILLIDQSVEGYSTSWLWEWFHDKCKKFELDPGSIIYLTGDQSCADVYNKWCVDNAIDKKIKVIPSISLSMYINKFYHTNNLQTNFNRLLAYKKENANKMYLFDCTNLRPRPQRVLNYLHLVNAGLADKGNISMSSSKEWQNYIDLTDPSFLKDYKLPADISVQLAVSRQAIHSSNVDTSKYYNYVERIIADMYENSWVSIVTESSYFDYEHSVFISEKTFKPIACMQPFIIVGSKHSLKYLRKLGYKTFSPFIDESYDDLEDGDRFLAIMEAVKKIDAIEDKSSWYESMRDIVEHNFNLFMKIGNVKSDEHIAITKYYFEYFKDRNVQNSL